MRVYADTSFIVRLIRTESDSPGAIDAFRRLGRPTLFFVPLHQLEVRNGILQRSFFQKHSASTEERRQATRERDQAFRLLDFFLTRGTFREIKVDCDLVFAQAIRLTVTHTLRTGAKSLDLLHIANALELKAELFLTCDRKQSKIAKAEGLTVHSIE